LQLIIGILFALKFEENGRERIVCFISVAAYWFLIGLLILRRRVDPTRLDLIIARYGFLLLLATAWFIVPLVWKTKGY
jgi:hypothetical protein